MSAGLFVNAATFFISSVADKKWIHYSWSVPWWSLSMQKVTCRRRMEGEIGRIQNRGWTGRRRGGNQAHRKRHQVRATVNVDKGRSISLSTSAHTFTISILISKNKYELWKMKTRCKQQLFPGYTHFYQHSLWPKFLSALQFISQNSFFASVSTDWKGANTMANLPNSNNLPSVCKTLMH